MKYLIIILSTLLANITSEEINTLNLLKTYGYHGRAHEITTDDGYILILHQISPKNHTNKLKPVLLMHGIFSSSAEFLLTKNSLALHLFNNGYDVFMGNARGNKYSTRHISYSVNSSEFWNFTLHDIGVYDLTATIDFILNETDKKQLFYIGHSQGATVPLILLSSRPEYNAKIAQLHLSAPAAFLKNLPSPILQHLGQPMIAYFSKHNMIDLSLLFNTLIPYMKENCFIHKPLHMTICLLFEFMLFGDNFNRIEANFEVFPKFLEFFTPYIGVNQLKQFLQFHQSGKFQNFDYGDENFAIYGSRKAPAYDLSNVKVATYIYCAERDGVVAKMDVEHLRDELPNVVHFRLLRNYNHMDFDFGDHAKKDVYEDILRFIKNDKKLARNEGRKSNFSWIAWWFFGAS